MEKLLVNIKMTLMIVLFTFIVNCNGQIHKPEQKYIIIEENDSLIKLDSIVNTSNEKVIKVEVYDEELIEQKNQFLKKSIFLPSGFSDHYTFEVIEKPIRVNSKKISSKNILSRKDLLKRIDSGAIGGTYYFLKSIEKGYEIYETFILFEE